MPKTDFEYFERFLTGHHSKQFLEIVHLKIHITIFILQMKLLFCVAIASIMFRRTISGINI